MRTDTILETGVFRLLVPDWASTLFHVIPTIKTMDYPPQPPGRNSTVAGVVESCGTLRLAVAYGETSAAGCQYQTFYMLMMGQHSPLCQ